RGAVARGDRHPGRADTDAQGHVARSDVAAAELAFGARAPAPQQARAAQPASMEASGRHTGPVAGSADAGRILAVLPGSVAQHSPAAVAPAVERARGGDGAGVVVAGREL